MNFHVRLRGKDSGFKLANFNHSTNRISEKMLKPGTQDSKSRLPSFPRRFCLGFRTLLVLVPPCVRLSNIFLLSLIPASSHQSSCIPVEHVTSLSPLLHSPSHSFGNIFRNCPGRGDQVCLYCSSCYSYR